MNEFRNRRVDHVHEAVESVNTVIKVILWFGLVSRLWFVVRESMESSWYMNKSEMESKNGNDLVVNASGGCDVWICKHAFDILCINLDNEIAATNDIKLEGTHCLI